MASGPRFYWPKGIALDPTGVTIPGALLNFYLSGSNTRTPTFSDEALTVPNANPVEADASGVFPDIFIDPTIIYKVVFTGPNDGITEPVQYWTADPVEEAWAVTDSMFWDQPFQFLGGVPPAANEEMGMYVAARPQKIFGDFNGNPFGFAIAVGACITAPSDANYVITIKQNNVTQVGLMVIAQTTGAFTFSTTSGLPIDLDAGEFLNFIASGTPDSTLADLAWTISGINT